MKNKIILTVTLLTIALFFNITTINAQFQTFPAAKTNISGEKVKTSSVNRKIRSSKRHIENNAKKKKIKTGRKFVKNQSCSNFSTFFSEKANRRQKNLARKRKRMS